MDKLFFWVTVALVGVLGVWSVKFIASQTSSEGLRGFAQSI